MDWQGQTIVKLTLYEDDIYFEEDASDRAVLVEDPEDYLEARRAVRDAASRQGGGPLEIRVRDERYWDWFRDLREIGSPTIISQRDGVRRRLEEKWGSKIPADLTPQEIHDLDLHDIPVLPSERTAAEYILKRKLGPRWLQEPSVTHIAKLALSVSASPDAFGNSNLTSETSFPEETWLDKKREQIARKWHKTANERLEAFYSLFVSHPQHACDLACAAVFALHLNRGDDQNIENRHGSDAWKDFAAGLPSGPHDLGDWLRVAQLLSEDDNMQRRSKLRDEGRRLLHDQLLAHWNTVLRNFESERKEIDLEHLLNMLPGKSLPELEALQQYVSDSPQVFTTSDLVIKKLEERYGAIKNGAELVRSFVEEKLIPPLPPEPEEEWMQAPSLDPWKSWLEQHYIPYKRSIDRHKESIGEDAVSTLEGRAIMFSDWFIDKYKDVVYKGDDVITSVLGKVVSLVDQGKGVVWVIWDNLPVGHSKKVIESARKEEFYLSEEERWRLSVLPSVTEVGIPASMSGGRSKRGSKRGRQSRQKIIEESIPDAIEVSYMSSVKDIEEEFAENKDLYVIHYSDYDQILHRREYKLEDHRGEELRRSRQRIFERIGESINDLTLEAGISLVISSDHGSTLLPRHSEQIPLPEGLRDKNGITKRAVALPEADSEVEKLFDSEVSTVLDPDDFSLDKPYVIARGFRSFKSLRIDDGYTHGGALPEEVLTPLLVFEPELPDYRPLEVRVLESNLRRGEARTLRLKIINYNEAPLSSVYVRLEKKGEIVAREKIERIQGSTFETIDTSVKVNKFDQIDGGSVEIQAQLSAHYLGRTENQTEYINASASERAVDTQTGEELDSFFD